MASSSSFGSSGAFGRSPADWGASSGPAPQRESATPGAGRQQRAVEQLATGRSPRQQEIARRIYARLRAGEQVDDLRGLIAELSREATGEAARRRTAGPSGPTGFGTGDARTGLGGVVA